MKFVYTIFYIFLSFTYINASELEKVSLQLHWKYQYEFSGFIIAKEKGFYKDVGLDVELKEISFGDDRYKMLENKASEFFIFSSDIIGEQLKGLPATLVSSYFQRSPLAFATKTNIFFPIDLKDKKVMGTTNYEGNIIFENMFYSANMGFDEIEFVPHSFDIEDFISGKVDAIQIYIINELYELDRRKVPYNIIDVNNYGIEFNGIIVSTHKDYAKENPDIVKKFHEASTKGWQYALDNKEEAIDIILEKYNTQNKSKDALMYEAKRSENVILPNVYPLGSLSENKIQQVIDMYEKIGILKDINVEAKDLIFNHKDINKIQLTPKEKAFLIKKGALNLCTAPDWIPYAAISEDNKHIGLAADLYKHFSKNLDINFNLVKTTSWSESLEFMKENKCDILSFAQENKDRKSYMNFTTPLMELNYVIATKSSELFIDDFKKVLNKKFVSVKDDAVTLYLKETYPNINLIEVDTILEALKMVSNNEAFGFIDTTLAIGHSITKHGLHDLKITGGIDWISKQSVATSLSEPILHLIMQKAVDSISLNQKNEMMNKLVNIKYEKGIDHTLVWRIVIVSSILILLFIYWNRKLKLLNDQLIIEKKRAQDATKAKSQFLANMSHEIRTPINGIIGMNHLVLKTSLDKKQTDYLQKIDDSARLLLVIVNDILDFSKIEAGKLNLEKVDFKMSQLVKDLKNVLQLKAIEKGLDFSITLDTKEDNIFYGDNLRLAQVLINLINNAIKFTHNGKVELFIDLLENDQVRFTVEDTGIGLSKVEQDKLFQSFSQIDGSSTRKYGGTGLGLSISKQLVELMDGKIWVESEKGLGSKFIFQVTLIKGNIDNIKKDTIENNLDQKLDFEKSHILLVEDNQINQEIIQGLLEDTQIELDIANNGKEAIEKFQQKNYELILMDIQMPVMDGYEATKKIRKENKNIPIIALTANAMKEDIEKTKNVQMNEHLSKPVDAENLYRVFYKYLSTHSCASKNTGEICIPDFKTIDTKLALSYLDGNQKLYLKILNKFYSQYITLELECLNKKELEIEIHTLKSLSLSIGAIKLFEVVKNLENTLKPEFFGDMYKELNLILDELEMKLDIKVDLEKNSLIPIDEEKKDTLFQSLSDAIKTNRPKKYNLILDEMKLYKLSNEDSILFTKICKSLENYEFDTALSLISTNSDK